MNPPDNRAYVSILTIVLGALIAVSNIPTVTGNVAYFQDYDSHEDILEKICQKYYGDAICDDSPQECGSAYIENYSINQCKECSTDGFDC